MSILNMFERMSKMKHWLRQYEALAFARMKRSARFVPNVPKARFIAEGGFIFHASLGALHSAKTKDHPMGNIT